MGEAERCRRHEEDQRAVGEHEGAEIDADQRRQAERDHGDERRRLAEEDHAQAIDQPGGAGEQRDEGQAQEEEGLAAGQPTDGGSDPHGHGRVIDVAQRRNARDDGDIGLIDIGADDRRDHQAHRDAESDDGKHRRQPVRPGGGLSERGRGGHAALLVPPGGRPDD